jgi:hypothetical protein
MAQTIAMQRGVLTTNWTDASSSAPLQTIFTQSGGTATRVICNSLQMTTNYNIQGTIQFYLINASSGAATVIGMSRPNTSWYNLAILPRTETEGYNSGAGIYPSGYFITQANSAVANMSLATPASAAAESQQGNNLMFFPKNQWMGNGDSIAVRGYLHPSATSTTVIYNFTTITES